MKAYVSQPETPSFHTSDLYEAFAQVLDIMASSPQARMHITETAEYLRSVLLPEEEETPTSVSESMDRLATELDEKGAGMMADAARRFANDVRQEELKLAWQDFQQQLATLTNEYYLKRGAIPEGHALAVTVGFIELDKDEETRTDGELLDYMGTDGIKWAHEFCKISRRIVGINVPEDFVHSWFCSAIESGRSAGRRCSENTNKDSD
jgi:hypothetical protein